MARVKQVKAAKDYPQFKIAKGDIHYFVRIKTGPYSSREMRQKTPFSRSQLTSSAFLSGLYDWEDSKSNCDSPDAARALAETIRELGEAEREKYDGMPEGLQSGPTGELLDQRAEACETAACELEEIADEWEAALDEWETAQQAYDDYQDYLRRKDEGCLKDDEPEVDEADEPEVDDSDFTSRVGDVEVSL